jgi:hypothetical protein
MPSRTEVGDDRPIRGDKALCMAGGLEPSHGSFPLTRQLMGVFRSG